MAKFELTIYGENDEIEKKYETEFVRWGVLMQAVELKENGLDDMTDVEQFKIINGFVKKIFPSLTDDELAKADMQDVMNTFKQLLRATDKIGGNSKNVKGATAK